MHSIVTIKYVYTVQKINKIQFTYFKITLCEQFEYFLKNSKKLAIYRRFLFFFFKLNNFGRKKKKDCYCKST